ncbi:hypothetical protein G6F31_013295 [Rhizopus arrhizus]|nr:hypothetical protein G6F31_013295 [Rhizopus arrhizus]
MAAKMIDAGKDVTYYENIEGGHGGAANNAQAAHMSALAYSFLWERLGAAGTTVNVILANASTRAQSAPPLPAIVALPACTPGARAGWRDGSRNPGPGTRPAARLRCGSPVRATRAAGSHGAGGRLRGAARRSPSMLR